MRFGRLVIDHLAKPHFAKVTEVPGVPPHTISGTPGHQELGYDPLMTIDTYHLMGIHLYCDHDDVAPQPAVEPAGAAVDDTDQAQGARGRGRPIKTEAFKDLLSTGRKRAAKLYAIQPGQICEWAWKKKCGGGVEPITGCTGRLASNIHHGPDKSVLNNRPDNVSVICAFCHNKWHALNDKYYEGERPIDGAEWLPNKKYSQLGDIEEAEKIEIITFEIAEGRRVEESILKTITLTNES